MEDDISAMSSKLISAPEGRAKRKIDGDGGAENRPSGYGPTVRAAVAARRGAERSLRARP